MGDGCFQKTHRFKSRNSGSLFHEIIKLKGHTLPETNTSPLKNDGWKTNRVLLGVSLFAGVFAVSFKEG